MISFYLDSVNQFSYISTTGEVAYKVAGISYINFAIFSLAEQSDACQCVPIAFLRDEMEGDDIMHATSFCYWF